MHSLLKVSLHRHLAVVFIWAGAGPRISTSK
jgi:hypothetical protein